MGRRSRPRAASIPDGAGRLGVRAGRHQRRGQDDAPCACWPTSLRPDEGDGPTIDGELIAGNAKKRKELFFLPDDPYYAAGTTVEKLVALYKGFYSI